MSLTKQQKKLRFKILDKIYSKIAISRIDISKETGITPATVSEITGRLIQENLIHELGEVVSQIQTSGRKKILLGILPKHSFYIGSELSSKYISFCLTDNTGKVFLKEVIRIDSCQLDSILNEYQYINELQKFIQNCSEYQPRGIGIAIPGHYKKDSDFIISNNHFWKNFNLKQIVNSIQLPIFFENNVKCMTLSERIFNSDGKDDNFIFFNLARGMFCSYMYNGELYAKNNFLVGEIGHIVVHPDGELCECGKRGCLQTYASESWIIRKSHILYKNSKNTYLKQLVKDKNEITIETILNAYILGDEGINNILHSAIKYIAIVINNLLMIIDSNKIIVHGEIFSELLLVDLFKEYLNENQSLLSIENEQTIIVKDYYNYNGAIAGASLCISKMLIEHYEHN